MQIAIGCQCGAILVHVAPPFNNSSRARSKRRLETRCQSTIWATYLFFGELVGDGKDCKKE